MASKWRRSAGGWWSEVYDAATPPSRFGAFRGLVSTWQTKVAGAAAPPCWTDFDIRDFRGWYSRLMMAEWPSGRIRLFETELVRLFGKDYTRDTLDDAFGSMSGFVKMHVAAIAADRGIGLCRINFEFAGKTRLHAEVLTLPLVSARGTELYLAAFEPLARRP